MSLTEAVGAGAFQLNTEALVASVIALETRPVTAAEDVKKTLSLKSSALTDLRSSLSALRSKAQALTQTGATSPFQAKTVSASEVTVATATASPSAAAAVHTLSVSQIAKLSTVVSKQLLTGTATDVVTAEGAGAKSVKITYDGTDPAISGTAIAVNVTLTAGDTNATILANLAAAINNDSTLGAKVSASIVGDTATTARLVLSSKLTGLANKVRAADTTGTLLNTIGLNSEGASVGTGGGFLFADTILDATFKLDGLAITRSSNSVSDVLTGVTINLQGLSTSDETLTVSSDKTSMKASIQAFLDAYNKALVFVRDRTKVSSVGAASQGVETEVKGLLARDITYVSLVSHLKSDVGSSVSSVVLGNPALLSDVGITADKGGTLSISNTTKFDSAVNTKLSGLADLFASTNGVATRLITRLDGFVNNDGMIDSTVSATALRTKNIDQQIDRLKKRLAIRETALRKQMDKMQSVLFALSAQRFLYE